MSKTRAGGKAVSGSMIVPVRVPEDMRKRVRGVAEKSRLSDADIMRLSIERGIAAVEKMFEKPEEAAA